LIGVMVARASLIPIKAMTATSAVTGPMRLLRHTWRSPLG
jgi:hypothetical protein